MSEYKGPRVHRPASTAVWEHENRWGSQIGDSTTLYVRRTDGGELSICYGTESIAIRKELVERFAEMVTAAATWTDDPDARRGRETDRAEEK